MADERVQRGHSRVDELGDLRAQLLHDARQRALQHAQLEGQLPVDARPAAHQQQLPRLPAQDAHAHAGHTQLMAGLRCISK